MLTIISLAVFFALIILCAYAMYVRLIQLKNKVAEAFSGIDVQLKKRYDLIPNILTIARKFMDHEKEVFEKITALRTQALELTNDLKSAKQKFELDKQIKGLMGQLMVSVENYPQLKSDQTMMTAMQTYNSVEEHIAAARRFYNSAVYELNNAVEIFPSSLIATMIGVKSQEFFQADEAERQSINASEIL